MVAIDSIGNEIGSIFLSFVIAAVAAGVALVVVLFWAIPLHLILKRFNLTNLTWYLLLALIPSFVFTYEVNPFSKLSNIGLFKQALFCSLVGSLGATFFWYIAIYKQRKV